MSHKGPDRQSIAALLVYGIIYCLYVWKYSYSNRPFPELTLLVYGLLVPPVLIMAFSRLPGRFTTLLSERLFLILVIFFAVGFSAVMLQFDPMAIQIGRYPALVEWNERLFSGQFPYCAGSKPSGFPILFLLAAPFYWLGEVGFLQMLGFVLFAWVIHSRCERSSADKLRLLLLFIAAPVFAFEVCVRSDLVANAVVVLTALEITRRFHNHDSPSTPVWLGLLLGMAASTRGIFLPAYLITLPVIVRRHEINYVVTLLGSAVFGLLATLAPFIVWDWSSFWTCGPLSVQLSHIPAWLLVLAAAVSLGSGLRMKTFRSAYITTGMVLFGIVAATMAISLAAHGLTATVEYDAHFDMAYFGFSLPFIVTALCGHDNRL